MKYRIYVGAKRRALSGPDGLRHPPPHKRITYIIGRGGQVSRGKVGQSGRVES